QKADNKHQNDHTGAYENEMQRIYQILIVYRYTHRTDYYCRKNEIINEHRQTLPEILIDNLKLSRCISDKNKQKHYQSQIRCFHFPLLLLVNSSRFIPRGCAEGFPAF